MLQELFNKRPVTMARMARIGSLITTTPTGMKTSVFGAGIAGIGSSGDARGRCGDCAERTRMALSGDRF